MSYDELVRAACYFSLYNEFMSIPAIQRQFQIDYFTASDVIEILYNLGLVEPLQNRNKTKVIVKDLKVLEEKLDLIF